MYTKDLLSKSHKVSPDKKLILQRLRSFSRQGLKNCLLLSILQYYPISPVCYFSSSM